MKPSFRSGATLVACVLVLAAATAAHAQDASGDARLGGQLLDESGAPIPSVKVRLAPQHDPKARAPEAATNKSGKFTIAFCPPGSYQVGLSSDDLTVVKLAVVDRGTGKRIEAAGDSTFPVRSGQALDLTITARRGAAANALLAQANEALRKGDNEAVLAATERVLATEPDNGGAIYLRGVALFRLRRSEEAVAALRRAVTLVPKQAGVKGVLGAALLDRALALEGENRKDEALPMFAEAGDLLAGDAANMPEPAVTLTNAVVAYTHAGKNDEALATAGRLKAAKPEDVDMRLRYADGLLRAGRKEEAAAEVASIELPASDGPNRLRLAELQTKLGQLDAALKTLEPVAIDSRDAAAVLYNVAVGYVNADAPDKAIREFERIVKAQPGLAFVHHALGLAYLRANRAADAKRELGESLRLEPQGENAELDRQLLSKL